MTYVYQSINMRTGKHFEQNVAVDIHDEYWPRRLDDYDLQFCSVGNHFFNPDKPPQLKDGDLVTGWYLPHEEGDGHADTYLTLFAFDTTIQQFIWPEAFVTCAGETKPCPYIASTGSAPISVIVNEHLDEFTVDEIVKVGIGRATVSLKRRKTVDFDSIESVIPSSITISDSELVNVTGMCIAIVEYVEHRQIQPPPAGAYESVFKAKKSTIPWWEWQMTKVTSRTASAPNNRTWSASARLTGC